MLYVKFSEIYAGSVFSQEEGNSKDIEINLLYVGMSLKLQRTLTDTGICKDQRLLLEYYSSTMEYATPSEASTGCLFRNCLQILETLVKILDLNHGISSNQWSLHYMSILKLPLNIRYSVGHLPCRPLPSRFCRLKTIKTLHCIMQLLANPWHLLSD